MNALFNTRKGRRFFSFSLKSHSRSFFFYISRLLSFPLVFKGHAFPRFEMSRNRASPFPGMGQGRSSRGRASMKPARYYDEVIRRERRKKKSSSLSASERGSGEAGAQNNKEKERKKHLTTLPRFATLKHRISETGGPLGSSHAR